MILGPRTFCLCWLLLSSLHTRFVLNTMKCKLLKINILMIMKRWFWEQKEAQFERQLYLHEGTCIHRYTEPLLSKTEVMFILRRNYRNIAMSFLKKDKCNALLKRLCFHRVVLIDLSCFIIEDRLVLSLQNTLHRRQLSV